MVANSVSDCLHAQSLPLSRGREGIDEETGSVLFCPAVGKWQGN